MHFRVLLVLLLHDGACAGPGPARSEIFPPVNEFWPELNGN